MKNAIILHGKPSKEEYYTHNESPSNCHWIPWIQNQLIQNSILAQTIELPHPYSPIYEDWKIIFEQFNINNETILIGHSCGAGFLVRWLSENNVNVDKVVLVAPFLDPKSDEVESDFFNFTIDADIDQKTESIKIIHSLDDESSVQQSVDIIREKTSNIEYIEFTNKGHFTLGSMGTGEFPELKDLLI